MEPNTAHAIKHYNDLKHTTMLFFNALIDQLRHKGFQGFSFVDCILNISSVIEETTLMREQLKEDESKCKRDLIYWYIEGEGARPAGYRLPTKVKTFKAFRNKKQNKAVAFAFEFVTKMYRLDQINRKQMLEEVRKEVQDKSNLEEEDTMESINKLYDDDVIGREEYYVRMRAMFQKKIAAGKQKHSTDASKEVV
jgi:hypothetical protein